MKFTNFNLILSRVAGKSSIKIYNVIKRPIIINSHKPARPIKGDNSSTMILPILPDNLPVTTND